MSNEQIFTAGEMTKIILGTPCEFKIIVRPNLDIYVRHIESNVSRNGFVRITHLSVDNQLPLYNLMTCDYDVWDGVDPLVFDPDNDATRYIDEVPCFHAMVVEGEYTGLVPSAPYKEGESFSLNFVIRGIATIPMPRMRPLTREQKELRNKYLQESKERTKPTTN